MDARSVHATRGDNALVLPIGLVLVESDSRDVLRVAADSPAVVCVFGARELVDAESGGVVGHGNQAPVLVCVDSVDVGAISAEGVDAHDFPAELAGGGLPDLGVSERGLTVPDDLTLDDIVEKLLIGLVNCPEVSGVFGPIHGVDCRRVHLLDGVVDRVITFPGDPVHIDGVVMRSHGQVLVVWRVLHDLAPFAWLVQDRD